MTVFEITTTVSIEATSREDAEELLIELFETDPAIESWNIEREEPDAHTAGNPL